MGNRRQPQQALGYPRPRPGHAAACRAMGPGAGGGQAAGKGVGLALVRTIAANYEGRAWVESRIGAGSIFYFPLSAAATDPAHAAQRPAPPAEQTAQTQRTKRGRRTRRSGSAAGRPSP